MLLQSFFSDSGGSIVLPDVWKKAAARVYDMNYILKWFEMNEHFFLGKLYLDCIQSNSQFYADAKASFQQEKKNKL